MARLRAVVVIQAPGLSGTPRSGHVSRALMNASWTASSARSKSPVTRISVATARPCSSRKTRSTMSGAALDPAKDDVSPGPKRVSAGGRRRDRCVLARIIWRSQTGRTSMHPIRAPGIIAA